MTKSGARIGTVVTSSQIFKDDKRQHFRNLKSEYPLTEYHEMLFFDNEIGNIRTVSKLGVKCVHCPKGVTQDAWEQGLQLFQSQDIL